VGLPISRLGCGVLVAHQRALLEQVSQGVVVAIRADVAHFLPGIVGGPGRVHLCPLLAVGLRSVDGPKQPQPVALCLGLDVGPPSEPIRAWGHPTPPTGARGRDPNFPQPPKVEVRGILYKRSSRCTLPHGY
jgi:hypothetical protein